MVTINDIKPDDVIIRYGKIVDTNLTIKNWNSLNARILNHFYLAQSVPLKLSGQSMLFDYLRRVYNTRTVQENWISKILQSVTTNDLEILDRFLEDLLNVNPETKQVFEHYRAINPAIKLKEERVTSW